MKVSATQYIVNESVVCATLNDEAVLLDVETGVYFGLDSVGARIWQLLEAGASDEELVHRLSEEYEVEIEQLQSDVTRFRAQLQEKGLIRVVAG